MEAWIHKNSNPETYKALKELVKFIMRNKKMTDLLGDVGGAIAYQDTGGLNAKSVGPMTMEMRLNMRIAQCEKQLSDAKRAKEIFEKNPELEELINILNRSGF